MINMSAFIRTACHDAPVYQELENRQAEVCPVRCVVCRAEAGMPGLEDVSSEQRDALWRRWLDGPVIHVRG